MIGITADSTQSRNGGGECSQPEFGARRDKEHQSCYSLLRRRVGPAGGPFHLSEHRSQPCGMQVGSWAFGPSKVSCGAANVGA